MDTSSKEVTTFLHAVLSADRYLTELRLKIAPEPGCQLALQGINAGYPQDQSEVCEDVSSYFPGSCLCLAVEFHHANGREMLWKLYITWNQQEWQFITIVSIQGGEAEEFQYDVVRQPPKVFVETLDECVRQIDKSARQLYNNWDAVKLISEHTFTAY